MFFGLKSGFEKAMIFLSLKFEVSDKLTNPGL